MPSSYNPVFPKNNLPDVDYSKLEVKMAAQLQSKGKLIFKNMLIKDELKTIIIEKIKE